MVVEIGPGLVAGPFGPERLRQDSKCLLCVLVLHDNLLVNILCNALAQAQRWVVGWASRLDERSFPCSEAMCVFVLCSTSLHVYVSLCFC